MYSLIRTNYLFHFSIDGTEKQNMRYRCDVFRLTCVIRRFEIFDENRAQNDKEKELPAGSIHVEKSYRESDDNSSEI